MKLQSKGQFFYIHCCLTRV